MSCSFFVVTADVVVSKMPDKERDFLAQHLDALGVASGVAQGLRAPITSLCKLQAAPSTDETVIILAFSSSSSSSTSPSSANIPCGFLKYGLKSLYLHKKSGELVQCRPICLLDFYVDETLQRQGVGKSLFAHFLALVGPLPPEHIAYDRPSPKLYPFLMKHYGLVNHDLSPYGFAVFPGFAF